MATALSMSACIIPVAPDFTDPIASPNYAPYIIGTTPAAFTTVAVTTSQKFSVTVVDPNIDDTLYYRFALDYPPYTTTNTRVLADLNIPAPANGMLTPRTIPQGEGGLPISCNDNLAMTPDGRHQLVAIVADRPFANPDTVLEDLDMTNGPSNGFVVETSWQLQISCPAAAHR